MLIKHIFDGKTISEAKSRPGDWIGPIYHGSTQKGLRVLDPAMGGTGIAGSGLKGSGITFFTSSKQNAEYYADPKEGEDPGQYVYSAYVRMKNPIEIRNEDDLPDFLRGVNKSPGSLARAIKKSGKYDGLIMRDVVDGDIGVSADVYAVWNKTNIRLVGPLAQPGQIPGAGEIDEDSVNVAQSNDGWTYFIQDGDGEIVDSGGPFPTDEEAEQAGRKRVAVHNASLVKSQILGQTHGDDILEAKSGSSLPVVSKKIVWHVGDMSLKKRASFSHEGPGLSVSEYPDEWRSIARLTGRKLELSRKDGKPGKFANFHKMGKAGLVEWGMTNGWVEKKQGHRASWHDDEYEQDFYSDYQSMDELEKAHDPDKVEVSSVDMLVPTAKMEKWWESEFSGKIPQAFVLDMVAWLMVEAAGLDGVWWNDKLDPSRLSAPRGVIFPSKLQEWDIAPESMVAEVAARMFGEVVVDEQTFMEEGCNSFAYALHGMTGWPIWMLHGREGKKRVIAHVFVVKPGGVPVDTTGLTSKEAMLKRWFDLESPSFDEISPEKLKRLSRADGPLHAIDREYVDAAKRLIGKNPARFGVKPVTQHDSIRESVTFSVSTRGNVKFPAIVVQAMEGDVEIGNIEAFALPGIEEENTCFDDYHALAKKVGAWDGKKGPPVYQVTYVKVNEDLRRKGIGIALYEALAAEAAKRGAFIAAHDGGGVPGTNANAKRIWQSGRLALLLRVSGHVACHPDFLNEGRESTSILSIAASIISEGLSITSWASYGKDDFIVRIHDREETWVWDVEGGRAEIVDNVHSCRSVRQAIKILEQYAHKKRPPAKPRVEPRLGGLRCPHCGALLTHGTSKCPSCDEMIAELDESITTRVSSKDRAEWGIIVNAYDGQKLVGKAQGHKILRLKKGERGYDDYVKLSKQVGEWDDSKEYGPQIYMIAKSSVIDDYKNKGIGIMLYTALAEEAAKEGAFICSTHCQNDQFFYGGTSKDAQRLWKSTRMAKELVVSGCVAYHRSIRIHAVQESTGGQEGLADLRRRAHLATGREKQILNRYADELEKKLSKDEKETRSRKIGNLEIRYSPGVDPDSESDYDETFVIAYGTLYSAPGNMPHDEAIMHAAKEMGVEVDPMSLYMMNKPISGRRTRDTIWVWDNVTSEVARKIEEFYPDVKIVWQAKPFKINESAIIDAGGPEWRTKVEKWKESPEHGMSERRSQIIDLVRSIPEDVVGKSRELVSRHASGETLTLYRGGRTAGKNFLAGWSVVPEVAANFAYKAEDDDAMICRAKVALKHVAYFDDVIDDAPEASVYGEKEVILFPDNDLKIEKCISVSDYLDDDGELSEEAWERMAHDVSLDESIIVSAASGCLDTAVLEAKGVAKNMDWVSGTDEDIWIQPDDDDDMTYIGGFVCAVNDLKIIDWLVTSGISESQDVAKIVYPLVKRGGKVAILEGMEVSEDKRGKGIGKSLVASFIREAGTDMIMLVADTHGKQLPGMNLNRFYHGLGFGDVNVEDAYAIFPFMVRPVELASEMNSNISYEGDPPKEWWNIIGYNPEEEMDESADSDTWFKGSKVVDAEGHPMTVYRGKRRPGDSTRLSSLSFTPDRDVASVYAATPFEKNWEKDAKYRPGANVGAYHLAIRNPIEIKEVRMGLGDFLNEYLPGISKEEINKMLILLANRETGKSHGPLFTYEIDEDQLPPEHLGFWAVDMPAFLKIARAEDFDHDILNALTIDTFALIDSPAFVRVAKSLGHDGVVHVDTFDFGSKVSLKLVGKKLPDRHITYRPFDAGQIRSAWAQRTESFGDDERTSITLLEMADRKMRYDRFVSWFNGSKITNSNGSPLLVWHGTKAEPFDEFSSDEAPYRGGLVAFFTPNKKFAQGYGDPLPFYLNIKEPFDFRKDGQWVAEHFWDNTGGLQDEGDIHRILIGSVIDPGEKYNKKKHKLTKEYFVKLVSEGSWDAIESNEFAEFLHQAMNYDGVIMHEHGAITYGIYDPSQAVRADLIIGNVYAVDELSEAHVADMSNRRFAALAQKIADIPATEKSGLFFWVGKDDVSLGQAIKANNGFLPVEPVSRMNTGMVRHNRYDKKTVHIVRLTSEHPDNVADLDADNPKFYERLALRAGVHGEWQKLRDAEMKEYDDAVAEFGDDARKDPLISGMLKDAARRPFIKLVSGSIQMTPKLAKILAGSGFTAAKLGKSLYLISPVGVEEVDSAPVDASKPMKTVDPGEGGLNTQEAALFFTRLVSSFADVSGMKAVRKTAAVLRSGHKEYLDVALSMTFGDFMAAMGVDPDEEDMSRESRIREIEEMMIQFQDTSGGKFLMTVRPALKHETDLVDQGKYGLFMPRKPSKGPSEDQEESEPQSLYNDDRFSVTLSGNSGKTVANRITRRDEKAAETASRIWAQVKPRIQKVRENTDVSCIVLAATTCLEMARTKPAPHPLRYREIDDGDVEAWKDPETRAKIEKKYIRSIKKNDFLGKSFEDVSIEKMERAGNSGYVLLWLIATTEDKEPYDFDDLPSITIPKGTTLYHGTTGSSAKEIATKGIRPSSFGALGWGVYLTPDKGEAGEFWAHGMEPMVIEFEIVRDLRLLDVGKKAWNSTLMGQIAKASGVHSDVRLGHGDKKIAEFLQSKGFDGIWSQGIGKVVGGWQVTVFDPADIRHADDVALAESVGGKGYIAPDGQWKNSDKIDHDLVRSGHVRVDKGNGVLSIRIEVGKRPTRTQRRRIARLVSGKPVELNVSSRSYKDFEWFAPDRSGEIVDAIDSFFDDGRIKPQQSLAKLMDGVPRMDLATAVRRIP
jgi:GNAT superfamily N-acetyltransferase